jgi:hypothetical protein
MQGYPRILAGVWRGLSNRMGKGKPPPLSERTELRIERLISPMSLRVYWNDWFAAERRAMHTD